MEEGLHIALAAERLFTIWGIPITNTILTSWVVIGIILILAFIVRKNLSLIPGKLQNLVEMFFEYLLHLMEQTLGDRKLAIRYFPLIATIFIFVLFANWFSFVPLIETIKVMTGDHGETHASPLFYVINADLNMPLALAIISFLVIEISGIVTLGVLKYGSKFVNFSGGVMGFIVGLIEIIGNLARLISLSFRLFGAIFAGHVLLLVVGTFVPLIAPVPLMAFEAFIGLLQAAIFAILTLAFIKLAITDHAH